jgi:hypothetical protein
MPKQAPLRLIKRCRLYVPRGERKKIPHVTRGLYFLYKKRPGSKGKKRFVVAYIGVGGVSKKANTGIGARIKSHVKNFEKEDWTHYSFYEVHDNISRQEILQLEDLFLRIFRHHDPRLLNRQLGSPILWKLSKDSAWRDVR